jgi:ATP-binding cassette subfamily C protein
MRRYIFAHPWILSLAALIGGLAQGLVVVVSLLSGRIIDSLVAGEREIFLSYIGMAAGVIILILFTNAIGLRFFWAYTAKSRRTLEKAFFASVLNTRISDFNRENSATYISVLNHDIRILSANYFTTVGNASKFILMLVMAIAAIITISPFNALILAFTTSLPLFIPILFAKKLSRAQLDISRTKTAFNRKIKDYLSGFEIIKTFGIEKNIEPRFHKAATDVMAASYRDGAINADVMTLEIAVSNASRFLYYFVAGFLVLRGSITVGDVVAIVSLSAIVAGPVSFLSNAINNIQASKDIRRRVFDMMENKDTRVRDIELESLEGGIRLNGVDFRYGSDKPLALKNISFHFKKGGKYAIVGPSGSGKSTVAKLITGYYDSFEGDVLVDGHDIREIDRATLYKVFSTLHQHVFLLDDTLRNNITLYNDYSDEEYRAALRKANLLPVEAALPNGSDTPVGEGGNTLSGGERQRIAIARALLKGTEVMVLDEATTGLDNIIAHDIESSIVGMEDLTCVFITHRYNRDILEKCDGILVMKDGELVEHGTFGELYEGKGFFYGLSNV